MKSIKNDTRTSTFLNLSLLASLMSFLFFFTESASAQWFVTVDSPSSSVIAGNNIIYRISAKNMSSSNVKDAKVKIVLPANSEFVNSTADCDGNHLPDVDCNLGEILKNFSVEFDIIFKIRDNFVAETNGAGFFVIPVKVSGGSSTATTINSYPVSVSELADLHVNLFSSNLNPRAGDVFTLSLTVDNFGPSSARKVETYTRIGNGGLGNGNDLVVNIQSCSFSVSQGCGSITQFSCSTGETTLAQFGNDIGTMATNILRTITAEDSQCGDTDPAPTVPAGRLRANFRLTTSQDLDLSASVLTESSTPDLNYLDNESTVIYDVEGVADISVTKTATGELLKDGQEGLPYNIISAAPFPESPVFETSPLVVTQGRRIQYLITVTNQGPSKAENVLVTDRLPPGVSVVPGSLKITDLNNAQTSGNCQFGTAGDVNDKMTCGLGTMPVINNTTPAATSVKKIKFDVITNTDLAPATILANNVIVNSDQFEDDNSNNLATAFSVISPLKGISGCSAGGSYPNILCGNGDATIGLNGFGFALPESGALSYSWSTDCLDGVLSDKSLSNPELHFTTVNPDNSPVSCNVNLKVNNIYASSTCSAQVSVIDCSRDCKGKIGGLSKVDRCGVCDGNGNSCLNCKETNISEEINKNLLANDRIKKYTILASRKLAASSKKKSVKTLAKKTRQQAMQLFDEYNSALASIPNRIVSCSNSNFCVNTSNASSLSEISTKSKSTVELLENTINSLRKIKRKKKTAADLIVKANSFFSTAQLGLANIPLSSSTCSQ